MAAVTAPTPPLLLTKRLNGFLHANATPQLPTLLLTTCHGKLLAHASPLPVSALRTHATVAASLLSIHTSSSADGTGPADDAASQDTAVEGVAAVKPATITVQLSGGTVVIRGLKCGLLFVIVGPSVQLDAEAASQTSAGAQSVGSSDSAGAASVIAMRRHAAELARWLDDKLGTLHVPDDGVGSSE